MGENLVIFTFVKTIRVIITNPKQSEEVKVLTSSLSKTVHDRYKSSGSAVFFTKTY